MSVLSLPMTTVTKTIVSPSLAKTDDVACCASCPTSKVKVLPPNSKEAEFFLIII